MSAFSHRRGALLCSVPVLLALAICIFLLWRAQLARLEQARGAQSRLAWLEGQITYARGLLEADPCEAKAWLESRQAEEAKVGVGKSPAGQVEGK